jgi:predicted NAD-dependent protein-ADP-ribosyltransferase YbiA (DUF1768 family)
LFKNQLQWRFKQIEDPLISRDDKAREEIKRAMANPRDAKRLDRQRQTLSKWLVSLKPFYFSNFI